MINDSYMVYNKRISTTEKKKTEKESRAKGNHKSFHGA